MPKEKDAFICLWATPSGQKLRERVVLYESSVSSSESLNSDEAQADASAFNYRAQVPTNGNTKILIRGFMAAFYVCLEELTVLKRFCKRVADPAWNEPLVYKDMEQLYGCLVDAYDMTKLDDMRKSLRDIIVLFNILSNTYTELQKDFNFTTLEKSAEILNRQLQDEHVLIDSIKCAMRFKEALKFTIEGECTENKIQVLAIKNEANIAKLIYEDVQGFARAQYNYNKHWEAARVEQKLWSVSKEVQALEDLISKCKMSVATEIRVHSEMERYCDEYIQESITQIDEWQAKYDIELEKGESQLMYVKNAHEILSFKHAEVKILFDTRKKEIEEWIEYRTKKEAAEALERKIIEAATTIQAWWRGQMFRKKLGPYRPKKRGKKGKKDKKGKKGKKGDGKGAKAKK